MAVWVSGRRLMIGSEVSPDNGRNCVFSADGPGPGEGIGCGTAPATGDAVTGTATRTGDAPAERITNSAVDRVTLLWSC